MSIESYEKVFLWLTMATMVVMLVAIGNGVLAHDVRVAGPTKQVDPKTLLQMAPFDAPGITVHDDGVLVTMVVAKWTFNPSEVRVPAGVPVTFQMSSPDIIHGFKVLDTNLNIMVIPGEISTITHVFNEPGTYLIVCHEYCGIGHQAMFGNVIVEEAAAGAASSNLEGDA